MQNTYEEEYAGGQDIGQIMEPYSDFKELSFDMVHALIRKITFYGGDRIEIQYAFEDELKAFMELTEYKKGRLHV